MSTKKTYTTEQKIEIVNYAKATSVKAAHEKYGASKNVIDSWIKNGVEAGGRYDKLKKFRDQLVEQALQVPEKREKIFELLLKDDLVRAKIGDMITNDAL